MGEEMKPTLRLGLIGDNIAKSQSPRLHRLAGGMAGIDVTYDRLVPKDIGLDFDGVFAEASTARRGVNVTYPYKEIVARKVAIPDARVQAIGAVNTVLFEPSGPVGYNTDYSGFIASYRRVRGTSPTGPVLLIGAGGVGRAIAFGLLTLGATEIRIADRDESKARALAADLVTASPGLKTEVGQQAESLATGASGILNGTPIGMVGIGGTPLPKACLTGARWAFDAVYTPVDTPFLTDAAAEGLTIISGYELFIGQGVDAWTLFSGSPVDEEQLRAALARPEEP